MATDQADYDKVLIASKIARMESQAEILKDELDVVADMLESIMKIHTQLGDELMDMTVNELLAKLILKCNTIDNSIERIQEECDKLT